MHKVSFDLSLEDISKIEGHASLELSVRDGIVTETKFAISEYKRFYTQALRGKTINSIPQLLARICGTCSNAHLLCNIEAMEDALGIKPSEQTKLLKRLTMHGLMIRDHALHLYLFVLPDVYKKDSLLDFDENDPEQHEWLHDAFDVKAVGNHISQAVAGRSVHAPFPTIGGFIKIIEKAAHQPLIDELKKIRPRVLKLIALFEKRPSSFVQESLYAAIVGDPFTYLDGELIDSKGNHVSEKEYRNHLEHVVIPYSEASGYTFEGGYYRVGALARLNLSKDTLHPNTRKDAASALKLFPSHDVFDNNLAQAIEILHSIDESIDILSNNSFVPEEPPKWEARDAVGVGTIEAPRGTLYHKMTITKEGTVKEGEVIVPTGQNQIMIERDIKEYVQANLEKPKADLERGIEEVIRAYDPCMSCASHFLEVKWR